MMFHVVSAFENPDTQRYTAIHSFHTVQTARSRLQGKFLPETQQEVSHCLSTESFPGGIVRSPGMRIDSGPVQQLCHMYGSVTKPVQRPKPLQPLW